MTSGSRWGRVIAVGSVVLAVASALFTTPALASAPHIATSLVTDTCAMCHRAHTATGDLGRVQTGSWEMTGSALAFGSPDGSGDVQLCLVCHGLEALGSDPSAEVLSDFLEDSVHSLAPNPAPFGPSVKYCSSCHDAHGANKVTTGTPYPRLLRSRTASGTAVFSGAAYCGTCHTKRPASRFDSVSVYEQTAHFAEVPDPAGGTDVRCLVCHTAHGSAIAPLITSEIQTPAVAAPAPVAANDRTLCLICHDVALGTFPGPAGYAASGHAASEATVAITGEWPDADASRGVGECQVCHAPMGRDAGDGTPYPSLLDDDPSALCLRCHDVDGPAETDLVALGYPASASSHLELVAAISPETTTAALGTLALWGTAPGDAPRDLLDAREYHTSGLVGPMGVGDIDGDGTTDVVVAHADDASVTVFTYDELKGLTSYFGPGELAIDTVADHLVVADVLDDLDDLPEICVISGGTLRLYRYELLPPFGLTLVTSVGGLGADVTGIAAGDLTADGFAELVVTDANASEIHVLSETAPDTLGVTSFAALSGVRGPSVGEIWSGEGVLVAVANADETSDSVSVYRANGDLVMHAKADAEAGARPWATHIADVLPGASTAGAELAVAVNGGEATTSTVNVFPQVVGGFGAPQRYDTRRGAATGSLAAGDIDGDGRAELVAGSGGTWSRDSALALAPSVLVFQHTSGGSALDPSETVELRFGGVERAGTPPSLVVVDLGGVGPSRHPWGAIEGAHTPTETATMPRHVECADCHDVHEATSTPTFAAAAPPALYGRILGVFGISLDFSGLLPAIGYGEKQPATAEYEICLKCHSGYSNLEGGRDIAAEVDPRNTSVHAVVQSVTATAQSGTFQPGWGPSSMLHCVDCHDSSDASLSAVRGPHASAQAPLLKRPYRAAVPRDSALLCYACHTYTTYLDPTSLEDTGTAASWFADATDGPLHGLHTRDHGFSCASCHASHGSRDNERLIRDAIVFEATGGGGSCIGPCHPSPDGGLTPGVTYTR